MHRHWQPNSNRSTIYKYIYVCNVHTVYTPYRKSFRKQKHDAVPRTWNKAHGSRRVQTPKRLLCHCNQTTKPERDVMMMMTAIHTSLRAHFFLVLLLPLMIFFFYSCFSIHFVLSNETEFVHRPDSFFDFFYFINIFSLNAHQFQPLRHRNVSIYLYFHGFVSIIILSIFPQTKWACFLLFCHFPLNLMFWLPLLSSSLSSSSLLLLYHSVFSFIHSMCALQIGRHKLALK